jgi:aldehyde:ferredoxin oxidoreductase
VNLEVVMYKGGYTGRTAWVDLTKREVEIQATDTELTRLFLGGAGFGLKLLYDHVKPGTDPLGPDNILVFAPGPLTGTSSPCSSRMIATARSPLTGAVGMATSGGHFPAEMKFAGFDIIVIRGQAQEPTYLGSPVSARPVKRDPSWLASSTNGAPWDGRDLGRSWALRN